MNSIRSKAWFRPELWLVIGLPVAAIAASLALLTSAIESGGADAIADHVVATGEQQVSDINPDLHAQQLGLSAIVRLDHGLLQVLPVSGNFDRNASVQVSLRHPVNARLDLENSLRPDHYGWSIKASPGQNNDWIVQLAATDGSWRIRGRLPKDQRAALLKPAFDKQ